MENFMVRVWDGKNHQMIYPGECFEWTISLCGEVFRENKRQEDCEIMLFTGVLDIKGDEIYEGDLVSVNYGNENGISVIKYENNEFIFTMGEYGLIKWSDFEKIVKDFKVKIVDNIYEKAERETK